VKQQAQGNKERKGKMKVGMGGGKEKESEDMSMENQPQPIPISSPATERQEHCIRVEERDLWDVYQAREQAIEEWMSFMISSFGVLPEEIVVSRVTYNLMFSYLFARGMSAAGNWLGLNLTVSYDWQFGVNDMMFYDQWTGAEINYGGGAGDVIQFFEKDILKRSK